MVFRILLLLLSAFPAWAAEVAGVKIDDKARIGNTELTLTGAGLRKRVFFQVYAIGWAASSRRSSGIGWTAIAQ